MNHERQSFERAIAENRYDRDTRRIFADWLEEHGFDDEAAEQRRCATVEWREADVWLHEFANKCGKTCADYPKRIDDDDAWVPITYDDVIQAGRTFLSSGEYFEYAGEQIWCSDTFCQMGDEAARDLLHGETLELYWKHWQTVTGVSVEKDKQHSVFSCSC